MEKREREIASSDSDLTPKRTNFGDDFGDPMDVETETLTPDDKGENSPIAGQFQGSQEE